LRVAWADAARPDTSIEQKYAGDPHDLLGAAQVKVLQSQGDVISGLTEIDRQQRDVLATSAQLWQARFFSSRLTARLNATLK
jgi:hypothetical protein